MPGPYTTAADVLDLVAAALRKGTAADLVPAWAVMAPTAVTLAYNDVISPWLIRGYSVDQVDVWPAAATYNKMQAMWYLSTMGILCSDYQQDPFQRYKDQTDLLNKAADVRALTDASSTAVAPSISAPVGGAAFGTLDAAKTCNLPYAQQNMFSYRCCPPRRSTTTGRCC